jgi:hypothetical protein
LSVLVFSLGAEDKSAGATRRTVAVKTDINLAVAFIFPSPSPLMEWSVQLIQERLNALPIKAR